MPAKARGSISSRVYRGALGGHISRTSTAKDIDEGEADTGYTAPGIAAATKGVFTTGGDYGDILGEALAHGPKQTHELLFGA